MASISSAVEVVIRDEGSSFGSSAGVGTLVAADPVTIPITMLDQERQAFIEVYRTGEDRELVAVVEILSPTNKSGGGRQDYLIKRNALLNDPIHLIELDFLVRGLRLPMRRALPRGDYFAFVASAEKRPDAEVYAWSVRQSPPILRFPLKAPDPDILLDLGKVISTAYERGRYGRAMKYTVPLTLPLAPDDLTWAQSVATSSPGS